YLREFPLGPEVAASEKKKKAAEGRLAKFEGVIVVTHPARAEVFLDDKFVGSTPCLVGSLDVGDREFLVDMEGYHPIRRTVNWRGEGKVEIRETLRAGEFGTLRVVSVEGDLLVEFRGESRITPQRFDKVEAGASSIEVTEVGTKVSYRVNVDVLPGRTTLVSVDFAALKAKEAAAWSKRKRGTTAEETMRLHREFLDRFPGGAMAPKCRTILDGLQAEEEAHRRCMEEEDREIRLEACAVYLLKYGKESYPHGWYAAQVKALRDSIQTKIEAEAYQRIEDRKGFEEKRKACLRYQEEHPTGVHAATVREMLGKLEEEKRAYERFARENVFWKQLALGGELRQRFPGGYWDAEVKKKLDSMLADEAKASKVILENPDVEAVLEGEREFRDLYSGGPHADEVRRRVQMADEERQLFLRCVNSIKRCDEYLSRFPEGWYAVRVEGFIRTFAWPASDNRGIGFDGKLPSRLKRAEGVGEYVSEKDGAHMVFVPRGFFPMGTDDWRGSGADRPSFPAWVGAYFIDKYEVTNGRYAKFLKWMKTEKDPHRHCHPDEPKGKDHTPARWTDPEWNGVGHPVVGVDWFDAYAFSRWAGKRLPTEAQWEKAASTDVIRRQKTRWPWGNERPRPVLCRFEVKGAERGPLPVASLPGGRSFFGTLHMAGNVSEWCLDGFERHFYDQFRGEGYGDTKWAVNPFNGARSEHHTIRGGSWVDPELDTMVTRRKAFKGRSDGVGFRCALWYSPKGGAREKGK
ncbi:MAG: SUMF1/EgtB/PvdO family nonheme iron enzyme, partial [Planctomycetota bacterium]